MSQNELSMMLLPKAFDVVDPQSIEVLLELLHLLHRLHTKCVDGLELSLQLAIAPLKNPNVIGLLEQELPGVDFPLADLVLGDLVFTHCRHSQSQNWRFGFLTVTTELLSVMVTTESSSKIGSCTSFVSTTLGSS